MARRRFDAASRSSVTSKDPVSMSFTKCRLSESRQFSRHFRLQLAIVFLFHTKHRRAGQTLLCYTGGCRTAIGVTSLRLDKSILAWVGGAIVECVVDLTFAITGLKKPLLYSYYINSSGAMRWHTTLANALYHQQHIRYKQL